MSDSLGKKLCPTLCSLHLSICTSRVLGNFSNENSKVNENDKKNNREKDWQSNNPARLSCFFVHLSCHHFLTTTGMWKYLILHFVEGMNTRQQLSFSFRFEAAQIHFLSDIFVAVATSVAP